MTTQFNYVDRDAVIADAKNEAEIATFTEQIAAAEVQLSKSEADFEQLTDSSITALTKRLAGK